MKKKGLFPWKHKDSVETVDEVINDTDRKVFGAYNRVHRHKKWNLAFFWLMFGLGLPMIVFDFSIEVFHQFKIILFSLPITVVYWFVVIKYGIPRFYSNITQFLRRRYRRDVGENWGYFVDALDTRDLISIVKKFGYFNFDKMLVLSSLFKERSKQDQAFFYFSSLSALNSWGAAIFGGLIASLLFEIYKMASAIQTDFLIGFLFSLGGGLAVFIFILNGNSRRLARISQLLKLAALQAPRQ